MDPMLEGASWLDEELAGSTFAYARLGQRLRRLLEQLGGAMGASLPLACQDWAATKAAYRFFDGLVTLRGLAEMGSATCPSLCHYTRSFAPGGERLGAEEPVRSGGSEMARNGERVVDRCMH
jgi:hypothetical protein